jgi:peptidoglycan/LPS O-acetylase OafA/YrhL
MAVIAFHVWKIISAPSHLNVPLDSQHDIVNDLFSAGCFGVQLFFAVSGFILVLPFAKGHLHQGEPVKMRPYFLRRLTRLEPPYVIHLGFLFVLCWLVYRHVPSQPNYYQNPDWLGFTWKHLLASLFYSHGFVYGTYPVPNIVLWSLEVEVQFYLLAPLLALIFKVSKIWLRRSLIVGVIILLPRIVQVLPGGSLLGLTLAGHLQFFLVGFLWCDLYWVQWKSNPLRSPAWDVAWVFVVLAFVFREHLPDFFGLLPWLNLLMGIAAFRGTLSGWFLGNPWIMTIGGMCYTIYMYHTLLISVLIRLTHSLTTGPFWMALVVQFLIMAPVIVIVSAGLFILFERPFMRRNWPTQVRQFLVRKSDNP